MLRIFVWKQNERVKSRVGDGWMDATVSKLPVSAMDEVYSCRLR